MGTDSFYRLDFFGCLHADKVKRCSENRLDRCCDAYTHSLDAHIINVHNGAVVIEAVKCCAKLDNITSDIGRLILRESSIDSLGELSESSNNLDLLGSSDATLSSFDTFCLCTLDDAAGTGIGVLSVGTCASLKAESRFKSKAHILDTVIEEVIEEITEEEPEVVEDVIEEVTEEEPEAVEDAVEKKEKKSFVSGLFKKSKVEENTSDNEFSAISLAELKNRKNEE